jgi:hypothetical protein
MRFSAEMMGGQLHSIQILRAAAAMAVVLFHLEICCPNFARPTRFPRIRWSTSSSYPIHHVLHDGGRRPTLPVILR